EGALLAGAFGNAHSRRLEGHELSPHESRFRHALQDVRARPEGGQSDTAPARRSLNACRSEAEPCWSWASVPFGRAGHVLPNHIALEVHPRAGLEAAE